MSVQQLKALIEYLEGQPELALGRWSRSKEGRSVSKRLWQECAGLLNSIVSSGSVKKTCEQWRMFYNEYKHRLLKKIKKEINERSATGGKPAKTLNLTPLQERLYSILRRKAIPQPVPFPAENHSPQPVPQRLCHEIIDLDEDKSLSSDTGKLQGPEEHNVQATIRLAKAIEALVARLNEPIRIIVETPDQNVEDREY